jgi:hypothetical protein
MQGKNANISTHLWARPDPFLGVAGVGREKFEERSDDLFGANTRYAQECAN